MKFNNIIKNKNNTILRAGARKFNNIIMFLIIREWYFDGSKSCVFYQYTFGSNYKVVYTIGVAFVGSIDS